jgi:hypothetical protein
MDAQFFAMADQFAAMGAQSGATRAHFLSTEAQK